MIQLNPRFEAIFDQENIDQDCDMIARRVNVDSNFIKPCPGLPERKEIDGFCDFLC